MMFATESPTVLKLLHVEYVIKNAKKQKQKTNI